MTKDDLPPAKAGKHLSVVPASRTMSGREFRSLTFENRLALVRAASGRHKYELLVEAPDAERLIRRLPAQEVFLLIKELGLPDVPELLVGTDIGQFTAFLDLDCWQGDLFDSRSALAWLAGLFEGGEEKILETAQEIEFPLLVLLLKKEMEVLATPGDFEDEDSRHQVGQQNAGYEVEYRDAETGKLIAALLQVLQRHDPELFMRLLEAVRWEQEAALEEENYQERRIRLESLGFPDPFESLALYTWADPTSFDPAACRREGTRDLPDGAPPAFMLAAVPAGGLLAEVLATGVDAETAWELTWLLNKVMIAERRDIGDIAQVREASGDVFRYLNLALEHLCGADLEEASRLLAGSYLQSLFRHGFSLTLDLQRRARLLEKSPAAPWFDPPFRAFLDALRRPKPRFSLGLEEEYRAGERPFSGLRDLQLASERLTHLEVLERLFATGLPFQLPSPAVIDLAGCLPGEVDDLALSTFFLTALANRLLGRDFLPEPIAAAELANLHAILCRDGRVSELREETRHWLEGLEAGAGAFGDFCFHLLEEEFCSLPAPAIDRRYLKAFITRE